MILILGKVFKQPGNFFLMWNILLRIIVATLSGGIIGWERMIKGKAIGPRTMALISLGSAVVVQSSNYFPQYGAAILAGIITGIGFLGGGVIHNQNGQIKGLTTATTVWVSAIVGLTIGLGDYILGLGMTVIILILLALPVHD